MAGKAKSALRGFERTRRDGGARSELSSDVALVSDFEEDASGRFSPERAARLLASSVIRTAELQWTVEHVRVRLREAARGCERIGGRVGPAAMKSFWPDSALYTDATDFDRNAIYEGLRDKTRVERTREGAGGAIEISRILEALEWPMRYLGRPEHDLPRKALALWNLCEARNLSFSRECLTLGCSRRTANYRVDAAMRVILDGVIRDGVRQ
jgi:hypothetical protein